VKFKKADNGINDIPQYKWNDFIEYENLIKTRKYIFNDVSFNMFLRQFDRDYTEENVKMECPIIAYDITTTYRKNNISMIKNPKLSSYQFFSVVDPYLAFQTLEGFVDTHFTRKVDQTIIDEKDRYAMRGFNEMSFRKEKQLTK
jgi:hypothetical protein